MMGKIIFELIAAIFAAYGLIMIILQLLSLIPVKIRKNKGSIKIAVFVKNQQDSIEGIVRSIALNNILGYDIPGEIYIVDTGSNDETQAILKRLEKEYDFIKIVNGKEEKEIRNIISDM